MTKIWHGTQDNDVLVGSSTETNIFLDFGAGADTIMGGNRNDRFVMTVDDKVDHVNGGAGEDTIDYSGSDRGLSINLATGVVSTGLVSGVPLHLPVQEVAEVKNVEDVVGSNFNDTIIGSSGDNRIDGGSGNDTIHAGDGNDTLIGGAGTNLLDGGNGIDTVDYSSAAHSVFAALGTDVTLGGGIGGEMPAFGVLLTQDTFVSIENVTGSAQGDLLFGSAGANVIDGGAGNDIIFGDGGNDVLIGGAGDDVLASDSSRFSAGSAAGDVVTMSGGDGNDTLFGGAGKDLMDGGSGNDWVDYSGFNPLVNSAEASSAVTVDLAGGVGYGGFAEGDTYVSIENVRGTSGDDIILGDGNANILVGGAGNNIVHGGAGDDTLMGTGQLFGDDGNDTFVASNSGNTIYNGGAGTDTVDYSNSANGAIVDFTGSLAVIGLQSGEFQVVNGFIQNVSHDAYNGIENVEGSQHTDIILADNNANVIDGNGGNDVMFGLGGSDTINGGAGDDSIEGGADADHLDGGSGVNTLSYSLSSAGVVVNLAAQTATGGDATGDVISNFQNVMGSDHDDLLVGSNGNNLLYEEAGHNVLIGGGGQDIFAFATNLTGSNLVTDFHIGEDKIAIVGEVGVHGISDLHFTQTSGGTLITFANEPGSIMLAGVNTQDFVQHSSTELVFSQTLDPLLHG